MQTRRELYQLIGYHEFEALDSSIVRTILREDAPIIPVSSGTPPK
jgi:hypothetical protein